MSKKERELAKTKKSAAATPKPEPIDPEKYHAAAKEALVKVEQAYRYKTHYYSKNFPNYHKQHQNEYLQSEGNKTENALERCRKNAEFYSAFKPSEKNEANYLLGRVHYFKGENKEATALLDPLISTLPKNRSEVISRDEQIQYARRWNNLGEMYRRIHDNNAAQYFFNAINLCPILAWPHYNLAIWLRDHHDLFGAIERLDKAEELCRTKQINRDPVVLGSDLLQWQAERKGIIEALAKESNITASQMEQRLLAATQAAADEKAAAKAAAEALAVEIAAKKAAEEANKAQALAATTKNRLREAELYNQTATPDEKEKIHASNRSRSNQSAAALALTKVHKTSHRSANGAAAAVAAVQEDEYQRKQIMIAEAQRAERERLRKTHWYTKLHSKPDANASGNGGGDASPKKEDSKYGGAKHSLTDTEKKAGKQPATKKARRGEQHSPAAIATAAPIPAAATPRKPASPTLFAPPAKSNAAASATAPTVKGKDKAINSSPPFMQAEIDALLGSLSPSLGAR